MGNLALQHGQAHGGDVFSWVIGVKPQRKHPIATGFEGDPKMRGVRSSISRHCVKGIEQRKLLVVGFAYKEVRYFMGRVSESWDFPFLLLQDDLFDT